MSTTQGVKPSSAPAQAEAASPSSPAAAGAPAPDFRDDIVKALAGGAAPDAAPEAPPTKVPPTEEPPKSTETPPADPPKQDPPKAEEPPKQDPPKSEVPPAQPAKVRHPFDEADDPTEDEIDPKFTKIRGGFEKMRVKLRKAREEGQFGKLITEMGTKHGMTAEGMARWAEMGAGLNAGDPAATEQFLAWAESIGLVRKDAAPAAPASAPAKPPATQVDPNEAKTLAETIFKEDFEEDVKNYLISEDVARAKALKAANRALSRTTQQTPQPTQQPPAQPPRGGQAPPPAGQPPLSPLEREAVLGIHRLEADYAKNVPNWQQIRGEVQAEIKARRAKDGGISPIYWMTDFSEAVNTVIARRAAPVSTAPVKPDDTLPASRRASPAGQGKVPAKWDGEDGMRARIAAALTGGGAGLDDLTTTDHNGR